LRDAEIPDVPRPPRDPHMDYKQVSPDETCPLAAVVWTVPKHVPVHWLRKATRGCAHTISKGAVPCAAKGGCPQKWVVYLGFFEPVSKLKVVVIFPDSIAEKVKLLQPGDAVLVSRAAKPRSPMYFHRMMQQDKWPDVQAQARKGPARRLDKWLLHIWQIRALTEYCGGEFIESLNSKEAKEPKEAPATRPASPKVESKPAGLPFNWRKSVGIEELFSRPPSTNGDGHR